MKSKIALSFSALLFPVFLWGQSAESEQNNIYQEGSELEVEVVQQEEGHFLNIEQIGSNSFIGINQSKWENSRGGQHADIRQQGNDNIGVLHQSREPQSASLEQIGDQHQAYLLQHGFSGGELQVVQHGKGNFTDASQNGFRSEAVVEQFGNDGIVYQNESGINNTVIARQLEHSAGAMVEQNVTTGISTDYFHYNTLSAVQGPGTHNYAKQSMYGVESRMHVWQEGDHNKSYQGQSGYRQASRVRQGGTGNYADVSQNGRYNSSSLSQTGTDNEAYILQSGEPYDRFTSNLATVNQNGRNNLAAFYQENGGYARLDQNGNGNEANIWLSNSGSSGYEESYNLQLEQEGNENLLNVTFSGRGKSMRVIQEGNNHQADIENHQSGVLFLQQGNNHTADILNHGTFAFNQIGEGHTASIVKRGGDTGFLQEGNRNTAELDQYGGRILFYQRGDYNQASIGQTEITDNAYLHFEQAGNHNQANILQDGNLMDIEFSQSGNYNEANIVQEGLNHHLEVQQQTNGNTLHFHQSGYNNSAVIVQ